MAVHAVANTTNGEPVSRPTASKIPPQGPLASDGGAVGGIAVGGKAVAAKRPCNPEGPSRAAGVTGPLAQRPQRAARPGQRGPAPEATGVPSSAATGAPVEPGRALQAFKPSAARHRAWRVAGGTIWPACSARSTAACAERRSVRQAGSSFTHSVKEARARDPRARERAAVVNPAGKAGHFPAFRLFGLAMKAKP